MSVTKSQMQGAQGIASRINANKTKQMNKNTNTKTQKHIGISFSNFRKTKVRKNLERSQSRKKNLTYREARIRIICELSKTMQAKMSEAKCLKC